LPHYYFDIETTGLDSEKDKIITIQFQRIQGNGSPNEELTILKAWDNENDEMKILSQVIPLITSPNPWKFVPVGNNLNFEFKFLLSKIQKYFDGQVHPLFFHSRPHIDLKHVMILLNGGRFKGYHLFLNKIGTGMDVPNWYQNKEYSKILTYVELEARAFTNFYQSIQRLIFNRKSRMLMLPGVEK